VLTKNARFAGSSPHGAIAVLKQRKNPAAVELGVGGELSIFPTGKALGCADPKCTVTCDQQRRNVIAGELAIGRPPSDSPNAIKAQQAEFGAEPEIAIGRLCDSVNDALGEPVAHLPCGVGVLADVERGIQRIGKRAAREPNAQYDDCLWEPFSHEYECYFRIAGQFRTTEYASR